MTGVLLMRCLAFAFLVYAFIEISALIFVALLLTTFYVKKKVSQTDEVKWDLYFKSMPNTAYLIRFWVLYLISLIAISVVGYYIFTAFAFEGAMFLCALTIILGIIKMVFKFKSNQIKLFEKINKLRDL